MSHRTGLAPKNLIWSQEFGQQSLRRKDALPTISALEKVFDFRTRWLYSNWGYALADEVITTLSGESWGTMLRNEIFDPLEMPRTITEHNTDLDNVAEAYMALSNGTPYHLPRPFPEDGKVMEGACAVQSNVQDLLTYYAAVLRSREDQISKKRTSTPGNPLKQVEMLVQAHIPLEPDLPKKRKSYGLGWIRTELPNTLGAIGLNPRFMKEMPVVGQGLDKTHQCIYHQGSTNAFLTSVHMLPESHSVIVVLTNSMANNDTADWLGELFLQTVLNVPAEAQNDYVRLAKDSAKRSTALWPEMKCELAEARVPNTQPKDLKEYVGKYWNKVHTYHIEVLCGDEGLLMCFQGEHDQLYELEHYHYDTFSWLLTRDEDVRLGRFPVTRANFYLLDFKGQEGSDDIDRLVWVNDSCVPEGETFVKADPPQQVVVGEGPA
jgi:CubicO group peptidase (beta-lactamase class C family)